MATALVAMWFTFRDPAVDHRMVALGALLPDALDLSTSLIYQGDDGITAGLAHSLLAPVLLLMLVMLLTLGRRSARRRWLMLPIGMFWHLVFDGAWASPALFGWPIAGVALHDQALPVAQRAMSANAIFEIAGLVMLLWLWRTWGLSDRKRRALFFSSGRLDSDLPSLKRGFN